MRARHHYFLLLGLLVGLLTLFRQYVSREVAWAYPGSFDQAVYLHKTYDLFHQALERGTGTALAESLRTGGATGVLLPVQGTLMQFFFGSNRLALLSVNFTYFALLLGALFGTARFLNGRAAFGWLAAGLLLLERSPFFPAGGLFDFRMDFVASCLYTVFLCLLVRSDGLRDGRWLAGAAVCALLLFCFRFLTFVYIVGFFLTLWTGLLGLALLPRLRREHGAAAWAGLRRTAVAAGGFLLATVPMVALNWQAIHDYYVVSHVTGEEKNIRAVEFGISGLAGHLSFHPRSLVMNHLGTTFVVAWVALAAMGFTAWWTRRRELPHPDGPAPEEPPGTPSRLVDPSRDVIALLVVGAGVFAPWFVLTVNHHKTPVVINIVAPGVVLFLLVLLAGVTRPRPGAAFPGRGWWTVASVVVVAAGVGHWFGQLCGRSDYSVRRLSVEQVNALYDYLAGRAAALGLASPVLSTDEVRDWMWFDTVNAGVYERTGQRLEARGSLGARIFATPREEVFSQLAASDLVLLSTFPKNGPYPFYDSMRALGPEVRAWCETHLLRGAEFSIEGGVVTTYLRPSVPLEGLSGEWITPAGVSFRLDGATCRQLRDSGRRTVVFEGALHRDWLKATPQAVATLGGAGGDRPAPGLPARLEELPGDGYRVRVDLGEALNGPLSAEGLRVNLRLDGASFVPREIGLNADPRRLVVSQPTRTAFE